MRRSVSALAMFLLLVAIPLFAASTTLVDDVIRMSKAGVGDEAILAFLQATHERPEITADDLIAMSEAGVSKAVIQAMMSSVPPPTEANGPSVESPANQAEAPPDAPPYPIDPEPVGIGCWVFDPPVYVGPYSYPASPLWDPFWYQPRLDTRSGAPAGRGHDGAFVPAEREQHPSVRRERSAPPQETRSHDSSHESGGRSSGEGSHGGGSHSGGSHGGSHGH